LFSSAWLRQGSHAQAGFSLGREDEQSAAFDLVRGNANVDSRNHRKALPAADIPIVAFDYG